jgi:hypothetical protein
LINEAINKPEETFINNAGLIRRHTPRRDDERRVPAQREPLSRPTHLRGIDLYNATPQAILGGYSPHELVYGLGEESPSNAGLIERPTPRRHEEREVPAQHVPLSKPTHEVVKDINLAIDFTPTRIPGRVFRGPVRAESKEEV